MVDAISNATPAQPVSQPAKTSAQKPDQSEPQPTTSTDSVQLSGAAQAIAAAIQESRETQAQTAQEAGHGDVQAVRLLAKEVAAESAAK
jgi:hypothetical protein